MDRQRFRIMLDWYKERQWNRKLIQRGRWISGKKVLPWGRPKPQSYSDEGQPICIKFEMSFKFVDTKVRKR